MNLAHFPYISTALLLSTGCIEKPAEKSSPEAYARQSGNAYRILLPLAKQDEPKQMCFYNLSWNHANGKITEQKAGRINQYSLNLNDLVNTPNAIAGFGAVAGITSGILVTGFCLGITAGAGSVGCFYVGGAIATTTMVGGGAAAVYNTDKWETAFTTRKTAWVQDDTINSLIDTIKRKSIEGGSKCPEWNDFPSQSRQQAWQEIIQISRKSRD